MITQSKADSQKPPRLLLPHMLQRLLLRLSLRFEELLEHPLRHVVARAGEKYPCANGHERCEDYDADEPGAEARGVGDVGHVCLG